MDGITTMQELETTSTERPLLHAMADEDDMQFDGIQYKQLQRQRSERWLENIIALLNGDE